MDTRKTYDTDKAQLMAKAQPTLADLLMLGEYGHGFGYLGHAIRRPEAWRGAADPYGPPQALDRALVAAACANALTVGQLFEYVDSRQARHDADQAEMMTPRRAARFLAECLVRFSRE